MNCGGGVLFMRIFMANIFHQIFINQMANFWANNSLVFLTHTHMRGAILVQQKTKSSTKKKKKFAQIFANNFAEQRRHQHHQSADNKIKLAIYFGIFFHVFHDAHTLKIAKRNQNEINKKNFHNNFWRAHVEHTERHPSFVFLPSNWSSFVCRRESPIKLHSPGAPNPASAQA